MSDPGASEQFTPSPPTTRRLLHRLRGLMAGSGSGRERLDRIVRVITAEMVADICSAYVMRAGEVLELFATEGLRPEAVHRTRLRVGEGLVGVIAATALPLALADAQSHPDFAYRPETGEEIYHSLIGVPILRGERVLGVLVVQNRAPRHYSEDEVEVLQNIAMIIAELVASGQLGNPLEMNESPLPNPEELPNQSTRAAIFTPTEAGVIGLSATTAEERLTSAPEVRDFYEELRGKLTELNSSGPNLLGVRLHTASQKLAAQMPERLEDAIERLVWSSGNTLRSIMIAHDVADNDPGHFDRLDYGAASRLRDVVETFNQLAFADPALRRRDAIRPGPQEHSRSKRQIEIGAPITLEATRNRSITTVAAADELGDQIERAKQAGGDLPAKLTAELGAATQRNFFAGMISAVYRTVRAASKGDGSFISKEYMSGIYKTAGATTFAVAVAASASVYGARGEIIDFVKAHAELLKEYGSVAFEHSPGFKQMIEWLEKNIPAE